MNTRNEDVRRVEKATRADLSATLKTKMIGIGKSEGIIAAKDSDSNLIVAVSEGNHAPVKSVSISDLAGFGQKNIAVDNLGNVVFGSADSVAAGESHISSVLHGGEVTKTGDKTFSVSAGAGILVDNYTDPENILTNSVNWPESTINGGAIFDNTYSGGLFVYIDQTGTVQTSFALLSRSQRRTLLLLAMVNVAGGTITEVFSIRPMFNSNGYLLSDFLDYQTLEDMTKGASVHSVTAPALSFYVTNGELFQRDINSGDNATDPNVLSIPAIGNAATPAVFDVVFKNGSVYLANQTVVPKDYENNAGSAVALTGQQATIHYFYLKSDTGKAVLQLGQSQYANSAAAVSALKTDLQNFVVSPALRYAILRAQIYTDLATTNFSDTTKAGIVNVGESSGGGATAAGLSATLQAGRDGGNIGATNFGELDSGGLAQPKRGKWQVGAPATATTGEFNVSGSGVSAANGAYTATGTFTVFEGVSYPVYSLGSYRLARVGWFWLVTTSALDWTNAIHYGAGGLPTPAGFYQNHNSSTGSVVVESGSGTTESEVDSQVVEGPLYCDETVKARVGFNAGGETFFAENEISRRNDFKLEFNENGSASLPLCGIEDITAAKDLLTLERGQTLTGKNRLSGTNDGASVTILADGFGKVVELTSSSSTIELTVSADFPTEGFVDFIATVAPLAKTIVLKNSFGTTLFSGVLSGWFRVYKYSSVTSKILTTAKPATAAPLADGTAAVGTSDKYAREDHIHPSSAAGSTLKGTATVPALTSNTDTTISATVTGAAVGDAVVLTPSATLYGNLANNSVSIFGHVSAANTVSVRLRPSFGCNGGVLNIAVLK